MREVRSTRPGAATVIAIGVFLAACSHDPIQPAPVLMMGGNRATDATAYDRAASASKRARDARRRCPAIDGGQTPDAG